MASVSHLGRQHFHMTFGPFTLSKIKYFLECFIIFTLWTSTFANSVSNRTQLQFVRGKFDHEYSRYSEPDVLTVFSYQLDVNQVARVYISSMNATENLPLMVVVREDKSILSWQIPLSIQSTYYYDSVARTLCPSNITQYIIHNKEQYNSFNGSLSAIQSDTFDTTNDTNTTTTMSIEISSSSPSKVFYHLKATILQNFDLKLAVDTHTSVTPSTPVYFKFTFPDNVDSVIVYVTSQDAICMVMSVQPITCPVYDLDNNIQFTGMYQTVSEAGTITVQKNYFKGIQLRDGVQLLPEYRNSFYVVLMVKANDYTCSGLSLIPSTAPMHLSERDKNITVRVSETIKSQQYIVATLTIVACYLGVYIVVIALSLLFHVGEQRIPSYILNRETAIATLSNSPSGAQSPLAHYGTINDDPSETAALVIAPSNNFLSSDDSDSSDYDRLDDVDNDKNVIRRKAKLTVADLSRKPHKMLSKKYKLYHWNLITISIFYGLPVIQLVLAFQTVVIVTGNEDLCYFNFRCAHPLWIFSAFNNVYSNIGYMMLGVLFLCLVRNREYFHQKALEENEILETKYGVPRHFGLFYAMGIALFMEGVLSACYHICPSYSNFQFDTAFMYVIGCLGVLKVYQIRHPDINAHAHVAYCVMAFIILLAVLGVVYEGLPFWVLFGVFYIGLMLMISLEFYYKGQWKLNRKIFARIRSEWQSSIIGMRWYMPMYPQRLFVLFVGVSINLAYASYGLVLRPKDFPSYLLAIVITNLMLYCMYYVVMKLVNREKLWFRPSIYIVLAFISWAFSLYFYIHKLTTWEQSPAESREHNQRCVFLDFYDMHDVWHFLSSLSLFFSFMVVLTIDDDLTYTPQSQIIAF